MQKRGLNLPKGRTILAPASLIKRFAAYFIDLVIIDIIIISPFRKILSHLIPSTLSFMELQAYLETNIETRNFIISISLLISILIISYFTYFEYRTQQTPGKMLMNNFIYPEKGKLTFWNYLVSNLTFIPFLMLWILDLAYMIFSPKNQRFMEKLCNISVMERYGVA